MTSLVQLREGSEGSLLHVGLPAASRGSSNVTQNGPHYSKDTIRYG